MRVDLAEKSGAQPADHRGVSFVFLGDSRRERIAFSAAQSIDKSLF